MAFDFFSQPQGPKIDISLFPDAVSKGILQGNAQQTTGQAIASGLVSGIKTGADLYQEYQKIQDNELTLEIKRNQIEQIPVANKIQAAQATIQESQAALAEAKVRTATSNEAVNAEAESQKARQEAADAELAAQEAQSKLQFNLSIKSTDPTTFRKQFEAGQYDAVLNDPKTFATAINYASLDPTLDAEGRKRYSRLGRNNTIDTEEARKAAAAQEAYDKLTTQLTEAPDFGAITQNLADKSGLAPTDALDQIKYERVKNVTIGSDGNIVLDARGNRVPNAAATPIDSNKWIAYIPNQSKYGGKVLETDIPENYLTAARLRAGARSQLTGDYANRRKAEADRGEQAVTAKQQQANFGVVEQQDTAPAKTISFENDLATSIPYLSGTELSPTLKTTAMNHQKFIEETLAIPGARLSPQFEFTRNQQLSGIARELSDKEYEDSKDIQKEYSVEKLKSLRDLNRLKVINSFGLVSPYSSGYDSIIDDLNPIDPKEAYFQDRSKVLLPTLRKASDSYMEQASKIVYAPLRRKTTQNTLLAVTIRKPNGG